MKSTSKSPTPNPAQTEIIKLPLLKMFRNLVALVALSGMAACVPDPLPVDDIAPLEPKISVSSQLVADGALVVLVTQSISILEAGSDSETEDVLSDVAITDAEVTLNVGDETVTLPSLGSGFYGNIVLNLQPNRDYKLTVKTSTLGEVYSIAQAQPLVSFQSLKTNLSITQYDSLLDVRYSLRDEPGPNWYMVVVQKISATQDLNELLNPRIYIHLVADDDFDGTVWEEEFRVLFQDFAPGETVSVALSNISEEYYLFLKARNDTRYNIGDFVTEPLNYESNVVGGLGYFNLHLQDGRVLAVE